jgi:hypothetical protein
VDTRCKGVNKRGEPCRAAATAGGLCFFHANPNKAAELGRIGGRSKRSAAGENTDPIQLFLNDPIGVCDALGKIITDVLAGKIPPRVAASVVPFMRLQLLAFAAVDEMEKRVYERPYYGWVRAARKQKVSSSVEPEHSSVSEPEVSNVGNSESSSEMANASEPESSNVEKVESLSVGSPEIAKAVEPEISNVKKSEIVNGLGWPEMANAVEPEVSRVGKPEDSSAATPEISRVGEPENSSEEKFKSPSAGNPDLSSFVGPVLPMETILAMSRERQRKLSRERERQLAIETALASSLSHAFGLDEL